VLVCLVWEYSFSFIPQGMLVFVIFFTFSPGRFMRSFGEYGSEPGQFKDPVAIAAIDECVLVVDRGNDRCNARVLFFETNEYCL
jgi:hypothetical protein